MNLGNLFKRKEPPPEGYDEDTMPEEASSEVARERGATTGQKAAGVILMGLPLVGVGLGFYFMFWDQGAQTQRNQHAPAYQGGGRGLNVASATSAAPPPGGQSAPNTAAPAPGGTPAPSRVTREPGQLAVRKNGTGADAVLEAQRERAANAVQPAAARAEEPMPNRRAWQNRSMAWTIPRNREMRCLPRAPINSQTRGPIECVVQRGVWSEDGSNELFPFGTTIDGYLGEGMEGGNSGARRLYLAWDQARLPAYLGGVRVPLRGVGASRLGENGVSGVVDTHLWERIRAGVLLTVLQGGLDAATAAAGSLAGSGNDNTILNFGNRARGTGSNIAAQALQHDYNRPNTMRRDHAQSITVKLVDDVFLDEVFENGRVREARR